jgi:hypothetical protein
MTEPTGSYPNPLDEFVTYSYHFVMSLANTTTAFNKMLGAADAGPYMAQVLEAGSPGAEFSVADGEKAYLVLDTRRFSAYSVSELTLEHIVTGADITNPNIPATAHTMRIIDTTGLSFFNMLMDLFHNKVKSTRASAFFLLSIVFVGHRPDGTTGVVDTCHIPLMLLTLEFTVDSRGSIFDITFMEQLVSPERGSPMDVTCSMGSVQSITTNSAGDTSTIQDMVQALEDQLNVQSLDWYRKYRNDANVGDAQVGKLVQYMITVPKDWRSFKCDTANRSRNVEQHFLTKKAASTAGSSSASATKASDNKAESYSQFSFSGTTNIQDAVKQILESSTELLALASEEKRKQGTAQSYKIMVNTTTDATTYVVHVDIIPFMFPKIEFQPTTQSANSTELAPGANNTVGGLAMSSHNLVTYDYMFTGANKDILDMKISYNPASATALDMNVDIGKSRFASNAAKGQTKQAAQEASTDGRVTKSSSFDPEIKAGDPIFYAPKSKDQQQNVSTQRTEQLSKDDSINAFKAKQEYTSTLAYFSFVSNTNLNITIRGNPNIIRKYADVIQKGGVPPHPSLMGAPELKSLNSADSSQTSKAVFEKSLKSGVASAKDSYYSTYIEPRLKGNQDTSDPLLSGPDVTVEPVFCKINVKAPNIDYTTSDFKDGESQYTDGWFYGGAYQILFITTTFSGGEFTHQLSMIPYDVSGVGSAFSANGTTTPVSKST